MACLLAVSSELATPLPPPPVLVQLLCYSYHPFFSWNLTTACRPPATFSTVAPLSYALPSYCTVSVIDVNALGLVVMFCSAASLWLLPP